MITSLGRRELLEYIGKQGDHLFPDGVRIAGKDAEAAFSLAMDRMENSIRTVTLPGYHNGDGEATFSHMHADQYAQLLYFFGNSLWQLNQNKAVCDKLLGMNRALFSLFLSYKCRMPEHFVLGHPIGTILGNADYGDFLVVFQGVTVNTETDGEGNPAPRLGKGLFLGADAKIIGNRSIGDRVSVGVGSMVYQREIPADSVVFLETESGKTVVRPRRKASCKAQDYFNIPI